MFADHGCCSRRPCRCLIPGADEGWWEGNGPPDPYHGREPIAAVRLVFLQSPTNLASTRAELAASVVSTPSTEQARTRMQTACMVVALRRRHSVDRNSRGGCRPACWALTSSASPVRGRSRLTSEPKRLRSSFQFGGAQSQKRLRPLPRIAPQLRQPRRRPTV